MEIRSLRSSEWNFPLLIKFIDAADYLSIQVHPDDVMARERHNSYGKSEMWYIVESDRGELIVGFQPEAGQGAVPFTC